MLFFYISMGGITCYVCQEIFIPLDLSVNRVLLQFITSLVNNPQANDTLFTVSFLFKNFESTEMPVRKDEREMKIYNLKIVLKARNIRWLEAKRFVYLYFLEDRFAPSRHLIICIRLWMRQLSSVKTRPTPTFNNLYNNMDRTVINNTRFLNEIRSF